MIEEIFELMKTDDKEGIKQLIKENEEELGKLVYDFCVGANEIDEDDRNTFLLLLHFLIENGFKCDYTDFNGNTALHGVVKSQLLELIALFTSLDDLFTTANNDSITPIALAYTLEDNAIKALCTTKLNKHVNDIFPVNGELMTYFSLSIFTCEPEISKLIAANDYFDYNIHKPFLNDIEWEDTDEDKERIELIESIENGSFFDESEDKEIITDNDNKNLNYNDITKDAIIYEKIIKNDLDDIEDYLNEKNVEYELAGFTPLIYSVGIQDEELTDKFLKYASVNHRTTSGLTPVLIACLKGNKKILEKLIKRGAYLSSPLYNGNQPIFYSVANKHLDVLKLLLDNNVYINQYNLDLIYNLFNTDEYKEYIDLIKKYNNPKKKDIKYPFEDNYELGYDPTAKTDGFHGVKYIHNTSIGSRMISSEFGSNGSFGPPMILNEIELEEETVKVVSPFMLDEINESQKKAILNVLADKMDLSKEDREALLDFSSADIPKLVSFLTKDGKVISYNAITKELYEKNKDWKDIVDIVSTELNLVALCKDGTLRVAESEYYQFYEEVLKWKNIKEISAGSNCIYAIDKDNNLLFACSDMVKTKMGDEIDKILKNKKAKHVSSSMEFAVITDMNDNLIPINCNQNIKYVKDVKQIECSNSNIIILKNDGTLQAFGSNQLCTCNISKWHDIVRIQSTPFSTIGYAKDGEILSTENMSCGRIKWNPGFGNMTYMSFDEDIHNIINL